MPPIHPRGVPMAESRKFRALLLAIAVYTVPMFMIYVLVIMKLAGKDDFITICKWMGASLSPAFLGYIGGVALEGFAQRPPSNVTATSVVSETKDDHVVLNETRT